MTGDPVRRGDRTVRRVLLVYPSQLFCADPDTYPVVIRTQLVKLYSFLRGRGVDVQIVDLELEAGRPRNPDECARFLAEAERILSAAPWDVVGISCYTSVSYTATLEVARLVERIQPGATVVVGGYHCLAAVEDFDGQPAIDFVVRGDGVQFFDALLSGAPLPRVVSFPGTPPEPSPMLYEEYPYRYRRLPPVTHIQLSRGCPFTCAFCCEPFIGNTRFVPLPVDDALAALDRVVRMQMPDKIIVEDLVFGFNAKWRYEFLEALRDRRYKQVIWVEMRVDTLTERTVQLLSETNVELTVGLESASVDTLRVMDKAKDPARYVRAFHEAAALVQRYAVPTTFTIMLNFPGETLETFDETMEHIHEIERSASNRHFRFDFLEYAFYPGNRTYTEIGDLHARFGTRVGDVRWYARRDGRMLEESLCEIPSDRLLRQVGSGSIRSYFRPLVDRIQARQRHCSHLRGRLFWSYRFVRSLQRRFPELEDDDYFARDLPDGVKLRATSIAALADAHRSFASALSQAMETADGPSWPSRMRAWRTAFDHVAAALDYPDALTDAQRVADLLRDVEDAGSRPERFLPAEPSRTTGGVGSEPFQEYI